MENKLIHTFLEFAEHLANASRAISLRYFRSTLKIENKSDKSPVSSADKEAEEAMRWIIEQKYPKHGIIGEELGVKNSDAEFVWVLDPIDGTQSFVTGKPLFGTLISLLHNGQATIGVIDMPALGERWTGALNQPTLFQGKPVTTRSCNTLREAWLYATSPHMFTEANFGCFEKLRMSVHRAVYGAECQGYGLVASGWADLVCEDTMKLYDYSALIPIIEGANGVITDWYGSTLNMDSDGTVIAAGNQELHEQSLILLGKRKSS